MTKEKIRWACIQPLTGGMYLGAEAAIGHPAEFILSYEGLDSVKYKKDGTPSSYNNEYNLVEYLTKHDRMPKYYKIQRPMFDTEVYDKHPKITLEGVECIPDYKDLDIVVAVPVCSGLSTASCGMKDESKLARNCNMQWLAYYTLNVIKPKVYCFENAPTLVGSRGEYVREILEDMAREAGYSVLYYKTDTKYHHNCQKRSRTFVVFVKWRDGKMQLPPLFKYEHDEINAKEFFKTIPQDSPQAEDIYRPVLNNTLVFNYIAEKIGNGRIPESYVGNLIGHLYKEKRIEDYLKWVNELPEDKCPENEKKKINRYISHINTKLGMGLGYFGNDALYHIEKMPAIQFKTIGNLVHPDGTRFCSVREYLALMGMPHDFIIHYGIIGDLNKIGQNVPMNTAKFITENICDVIEHWNDCERETGHNVMLQNNISMKANKF